MCITFFDEPDQFQFSKFDFELIEYQLNPWAFMLLSCFHRKSNAHAIYWVLTVNANNVIIDLYILFHP